jgi:D-glycero-D-manno-heptose 1,7-bisphosphate phosphatase
MGAQARYGPGVAQPDGVAQVAEQQTDSREGLPTRLVVLDRDGTLVDFVRDVELGSVVSAFHPKQLRLLPGVIDGLRRLAACGYRIAIATNQPGAAKGEAPVEAIERTNAALVGRLEAEGIPVAALACCLHHPEGGPGGEPRLVRPCDCRKPGPGLIQQLLTSLRVAPTHAWMVGDSLADFGAARAAGVRCALVVPRGRCEICPLRLPEGLTPPGPEVLEARFDSAVAAIITIDRAGWTAP